MPEGTLFRQYKTPLSTTINISLSIFDFVSCDGLIGWGDSSKAAQKIWATYYINDGAFWVKDGDPITTHQPIQSWAHQSGGYPYTIGTYSGAEDAWSFGAVAYASTVGKTAGGVRKFAQYKINNGSWYKSSESIESIRRR